MIDTCYPLDIWNIGAGLGSECLCDQLPVVSLGTKSLMSFPDGQYFTCIVTFVTGGIRSRWFHWESTVGACASGLHPCLFFLAWFCLCSFGVIKLWVQLYVDSHESFVEPEGGLGDPWHMIRCHYPSSLSIKPICHNWLISFVPAAKQGRSVSNVR